MRKNWALVLIGSISALFVFLEVGTGDNQHLKIVFFDVGQGDATFIESPTGVQVLIDGGAGSQILRELSNELGFFDRTIDVVVATHPDTDHIGGLIDVLDRYEVTHVIHSGNTGESSIAEAFMSAVVNEEAIDLVAKAGMNIEIGGGAMLEVLFPDRDAANFETNLASIVLQLVYGETEFLLTGDAPKSVEEYLVLKKGNELESDVLKVGHHGSKTSTSDTFVKVVSPEVGIISAGSDNRYGHPHSEVLATLDVHNVETHGTYEVGTVVMESDGERVFFSY